MIMKKCFKRYIKMILNIEIPLDANPLEIQGLLNQLIARSEISSITPIHHHLLHSLKSLPQIKVFEKPNFEYLVVRCQKCGSPNLLKETTQHGKTRNCITCQFPILEVK